LAQAIIMELPNATPDIAPANVATATCEAAECFRVVFEGTCAFRVAHIRDCSADAAAGLQFWKLIRPLLEEFDHAIASWGGSWVQSLAEIYESENMEQQCPEYDEAGKMIEHNHFMLQVLRIPLKEHLTLRKLCQVALNLGQLSAHQTCFSGHLAAIFGLMMTRTQASDFSQEMSSISPPRGTAKMLCRAMGDHGQHILLVSDSLDAENGGTSPCERRKKQKI